MLDRRWNFGLILLPQPGDALGLLLGREARQWQGLAPATRRIGDFDAERAFRRNLDDAADGALAQMGFQERHQIPRRTGQIVSAEEPAVAGQDRVDARTIVRGRDLGIFEREALIAERSVEYLLRQRQDLQKPYELGGEEAFTPASPRSRLGAMVADHPEGGDADMAPDGARLQRR